MNMSLSTQASSQRIQKALAMLGVDSRRAVERAIEASEVFVNGHQAQLGQLVKPGDHVLYKEKKIKIPVTLAKTYKPRILLYNKPLGVICSRQDPEGRPTIFDDLPRLKQGRWMNVGRLDLNSSGLLLMSNHGDWVHQQMHPSSNLKRVYHVRAYGRFVLPEQLLKPRQLEDGKASFDEVRLITGQSKKTLDPARLHKSTFDKLGNYWYEVTVYHGRNRIVRRLMEAHGLVVNQLRRVQHGNYILPKDLHPGTWVELVDA